MCVYVFPRNICSFTLTLIYSCFTCGHAVLITCHDGEEGRISFIFPPTSTLVPFCSLFFTLCPILSLPVEGNGGGSSHAVPLYCKAVLDLLGFPSLVLPMRNIHLFSEYSTKTVYIILGPCD